MTRQKWRRSPSEQRPSHAPPPCFRRGVGREIQAEQVSAAVSAASGFLWVLLLQAARVQRRSTPCAVSSDLYVCMEAAAQPRLGVKRRLAPLWLRPDDSTRGDGKMNEIMRKKPNLFQPDGQPSRCLTVTNVYKSKVWILIAQMFIDTHI